jgi:hypothetical protein
MAMKLNVGPRQTVLAHTVTKDRGVSFNANFWFRAGHRERDYIYLSGLDTR